MYYMILVVCVNSFELSHSTSKGTSIEKGVVYASFPGPVDTPFMGGSFALHVLYKKDYPLKPPKVVFITQHIFHPNVSVSGRIDNLLLKDGWSPAITLRVLLLSMQAHLSETCSPHGVTVAPPDFQPTFSFGVHMVSGSGMVAGFVNPEAGKLWLENPLEAEEVACNHTKLYARFDLNATIISALPKLHEVGKGSH
jgi:ubiquitin-protein ligase